MEIHEREVSKKNPWNTSELKEEVIDDIESIVVEVLRKDSTEFMRRMKNCIEAGGGLMED